MYLNTFVAYFVVFLVRTLDEGFWVKCGSVGRHGCKWHNRKQMTWSHFRSKHTTKCKMQK